MYKDNRPYDFFIIIYLLIYLIAFELFLLIQN